MTEEQEEMQKKVGEVLINYIMWLENQEGSSPQDYFMAVLLPPFARMQQAVPADKWQIAFDRTKEFMVEACNVTLEIVEETHNEEL